MVGMSRLGSGLRETSGVVGGCGDLRSSSARHGRCFRILRTRLREICWRVEVVLIDFAFVR